MDIEINNVFAASEYSRDWCSNSILNVPFPSRLQYLWRWRVCLPESYYTARFVANSFNGCTISVNEEEPWHWLEWSLFTSGWSSCIRGQSLLIHCKQSVIIYKGAGIIYTGAVIIYKGVIIIYKGAVIIYKGVVIIYTGAVIIYKRSVVIYKGAVIIYKWV